MNDESLPQAAGRVFISYRREETAWQAGWLFDRLADRFGRGQIFKDVDSIQLGDDFVEVINTAVGACDVLLALIGDQWLTVTDGQGNARLDNPDDYVRLEIEAALTRDVRVIPILVGRADMPRAEELPASLAKLVRRNALELSPSRFEFDTGRLLKVLERTLTDVHAQPVVAKPDVAVATRHARSDPTLEADLRALMRSSMPAPHTRLVARRVTSSVLVGRTEELTAAHDAVTAAETSRARIVLIGGDAGIGKTRLIEEVCMRVGRGGMLAAVGGCVQLGEASVAYAPLVEALRDLRQQLGVEAVGELFGPGAADVGALLGEPRSDAGGAAPAIGHGTLFEHLLGFLVRLGARQPTLLVFEDMHWADPSTRDLVAFLARNLRGAAVALMLSYRTDELHRRHPLRSLLTDLERDPRVERIGLTGLTRPEIITLLGEITDVPPMADVLDDLISRTDGNPFYVEELVAASAAGGGLPATLAEAILARVSELPEPTSMVLHQAAVLGEVIDDTLLAEVTGQSAGQIADALREAVARQVLVMDQSGCRFRHALVREALYDDLLPGERERLHIATARALQAPGLGGRVEEHVRWTLLAYHAYAAHDLPLAFAASVRAGLESERMHALAAAAGQFERAVRLWEQVPDAQVAAGMTRAELILRAAEATHFSSRSARDISLVEAALAALDADASPEQRAMLLERVGRVNWSHLRGAQAVAAYEQAVDLLADRPPSPEQAFTLSALGQSLMVRDQFRKAEPVLLQAIAVAQAVGAEATEGHALCSLGPVLVSLGRVDDGLDAMHRAQERARTYGSTGEVCRTFVNLVNCLYTGGRLDEAERVAVAGLAYAESVGHLRIGGGEAITGCRIGALVLAGRWQEAGAAKAAFELQVPESDAYLEIRWLPLLLGQGRYDQAREVVNRLLDLTTGAGDVQFRAVALMRAGELAGLQSEWAEARRLLADGLAAASNSDDQYYRSRGYAVALRVEADRAEAARPGGADVSDTRAVADQLNMRMRQMAQAPDALLPETMAWLATAEADYLRVHGRDDAQTWADVAEEWDRIGHPYPAALARYRQADALLSQRRDRGQAATAARAALDIANRLGAEPLAADLHRLAQRGRLDLAPASGQTPPQQAEAARTRAFGLTDRELLVLRLVAAGRSNGEIGAQLFISRKTASVHVSNILRKLDVSTRVQAAAIAQRAGILDQH